MKNGRKEGGSERKNELERRGETEKSTAWVDDTNSFCFETQKMVPFSLHWRIYP